MTLSSRAESGFMEDRPSSVARLIAVIAVASYLAKYATKSTEPVGVLLAKITPANATAYADPRTHQGRLIAACLKLGAHPHEDFRALRRWAHMLGHRGHFATKAAATPPPCAPSALCAGTGTAASALWPTTIRTTA